MPSKTLRMAGARGSGRVRRVAPGLATAAVTTAAGLLAAPASAGAAAPALPHLLRRGSHGSSVARVQRALHVEPSGRFDRATRKAVVAFQRRDHLLVDGIVGPQTWDTLFHIDSGAVSSSSSPYESAGYSIPASIVECESGGDYSAVNPQTGAGGAYQILPSTWQAYGGQGLPEDASPAEQSRIAAEIYARQGASAWSC